MPQARLTTTANIIIAQLLYLELAIQKRIFLYVNSLVDHLRHYGNYDT